MVTIAHLVEKIVEQKPFLQEALNRGIVNNAALAEELRPLIEKEMKKKVKFSAVNMAIRRLSEKLKDSFVSKAKFEKNSDITIRSNLLEITFYKESEVQKKMQKLYEIVDFKRGDFLTITQGLYELMIIADQKHEKKILSLFPTDTVKKKINNLSSLTINIPESAVDTLGFFYLVTRALNWENINIIDIVSTFTEMTFIVKEEDTARLFETLRGLIKENS
ncbi:hypothetical protein HYX12_01400 [Candidatus Woesearchaeota archaeon]|nr:hypothetical protein [Candidatus Woesearchaeota archaeon]